MEVKKITSPDSATEGVIKSNLYQVKITTDDIKAFVAGATYTQTIAELESTEVIVDTPAAWLPEAPVASVALTQFDAEVGVTTGGAFTAVDQFLGLMDFADGDLLVNSSAGGTLEEVDSIPNVLTLPNAKLHDNNFNTSTERLLSLKISRAGGTFAQVTAGELYFYIRTIVLPTYLAE